MDDGYNTPGETKGIAQASRLAAVRAASQFALPTAEIAQMLAEIESGYVGSAANPAGDEPPRD